MSHPRKFARSATIILGLVACPAALQAQAPNTAEAVVARWIAASGGAARLQAVAHRRMAKQVQLRTGAGEMKLETELLFLAPDRVLIRSNLGGLTTTEVGFDGSVAWMTSSALGTTRELPPREMASVRTSINVLPSRRGAKELAFVGVRMLDGAPMHVITWASDTVGTVTEYFDVATGHRRAEETKDLSGQLAMTLFSDFRTVDGYTVPFREDYRRGADTLSIARITKFDHHPIPASVFAPPAALRKGVP